MSASRCTSCFLPAVLFSLTLSPIAAGQLAKPYRLHVLQDGAGNPAPVGPMGLRLVPTPNNFNTIAINNKGIIGGTMQVGSGGNARLHGFVWFPNDLGVSGMSFPLRQILDIHDYGLPSGGDPDHTIVNDVASHHGHALVGFRGSDPVFNGHAHVFPLNLTAGSIGATDLHTVSGAPFSIAYGADDHSTSTIVGRVKYLCESATGPSYYERGFLATWSPGGGADPMDILIHPFSLTWGTMNSWASDIARSDNALISGGHRDCGDPEDPCDFTVTCPQSCFMDYTSAVRWTTPSNFVSLPGLVAGGEISATSGAEGRDINNHGDVAGWSYVGQQPPNCEQSAALWTGGSTQGYHVGATMPSGQEPYRSWAEGISERDGDGCVTLVGINTDLDRGLIWYGFANTWCVGDANDLVVPCSLNAGSGTYTIRRAFDVNDYRHVTVFVGGPNGSHFGLLTHAADFNGDLKVNAVDRNLLLANLCSTGCTCAQLTYDLNGDGVVNAADMALLVAAGTSGSQLVRVPALCECEASEGFSPLPLMDEATALASVEFTSGQAFCDWLPTVDETTADNVCEFLAYLLQEEE